MAQVGACLKERGTKFFKAEEWGEAQEDFFDASRVVRQGQMPQQRRREAWDLILRCILDP
ncbi:MAG: hypothetical protein SGPRY_010117 [Prymnesium sp.]